MKPDGPSGWMWMEACTMMERVERLQRQFFQPSVSAAASWEPPVDIVETDREVAITAALPGVEPQDLNVFFDADELVITGLRRRPAVPPGAAIHRLEVPYGRFERRIRFSATQFALSRSELISGCLSLVLSKQIRAGSDHA